MAASSSSRLSMTLNTASTILKTKKTIETKKAIEFSLSSSAVESLPKSEKDLFHPSNPFIGSDPSPSPVLEAIDKWLGEVNKHVDDTIIKGAKKWKLEVVSGAFFAGAVTMKALGIKETLEEAVFREREYQKAALYNWASSPWTKGEASSDFINCGRDSVEDRLDKVKWNEKGLAVAIVQDADTHEVLMQTVVNREILATNISSRKATFYNQWPLSLLAEGKIPSNFNIHNIKLSCNGDSLVYIGKPDGPTCHTCSGTCYHNSLLDSFNNHRAAQNRPPLATSYSLEPTITWLQQAKVETIVNGKPALTKQLMLNPMLLCSKIRKEVDELCQTLRDNEERSRTASKMADVYHAMALLRVGDLKLEGSVEVLRKQFLPVR